MIFIYDDHAGDESFRLDSEAYKYLIKVRRHKEGDTLYFRNKKDSQILYSYKIVSVEGRKALLELIDKQNKEVKPEHFLHIGWCVIDSKSVERVLASLNEMGVGKITFIYCARSQKNFKPDMKRYERILEASNQQCGRSTMMEFATIESVEMFVLQNPDVKVFDFCDNVLTQNAKFQTVLLGCEGGFSPEEKQFLAQQEVFRLQTPMVLRSESAALAISAKILLS
jgi:16S rRNA (uracil1498-N3)-methyltransferase